MLPHRVCKFSRAAIRSSSAQTSAIRPAMTILPAPASDARRNTRAGCVARRSEASDAKNAFLLPTDDVGRKDRLLFDAEDPTGACCAVTGGFTLKGQFPRRGRLPLGGGDARLPALPAVSSSPDTAGTPWFCRSIWACNGFEDDGAGAMPADFSVSIRRLRCSQREIERRGAGKVERVDKAIPM